MKKQTMDKKILLISYHFPPSQAVGGLRTANFARYLPQHGWKPSVLTIKDKYVPARDNDRLHGLEGLNIYKTIKLPRVMKLYEILKAKSRWLTIKKEREKKNIKTAPRLPQANIQMSETLLQRFKRYFITLFLELPDYERNWVLPATLKAIREIRKQKIECILTSSPPHSVHLIGLLVNLVTGVNWIVDFRDPWFSGNKKENADKRIGTVPVCTLSKKLEHWMEKAVITRAKLVLCNTQKIRTKLSHAYSEFSDDKFVYIPNGISVDTFHKLKDVSKYDKFTLTYIGSLYFFRTPEPIFKALKELIDEKKIDRNNIKIQLVGNCETIDNQYLTKDLVSVYKLESVVDVQPPVSHHKALEMIMKSHLALLFAPDQPFQIPAKLYEYMATGVEILALAGDGATADMIRETKTGRVFLPDDHEDIKTFLQEAILNQENTNKNLNMDVLERFDPRRIVRDLTGYMTLRFDQ